MIKFDRSIWQKEYISNKSRASWVCSKCWTGPLQLNDSFRKTKRSSGVASIECSNEDCRRFYHLTGPIKHFSSDGIHVGRQSVHVSDYRLYPTHFQPELHLFRLPEKLGDETCRLLRLSFNHFWYDLDACANKIRQSLELIVKEKGAQGNNLEKRIDSLKEKIGVKLTDSLTSLRWIGNEGSHPEKPFTKDQILLTYSILVEVLNSLFPEPDAEENLDEMVQLINQNKGLKKS